jgi:hypothetical protein
VAAVHSADGAWIKAYNGGQVADVVALYEENSVIYPPGAPPVHGRAAIQEFFTKDMAEFAKTGFVLALNPNPDGGCLERHGLVLGHVGLERQGGAGHRHRLVFLGLPKGRREVALRPRQLEFRQTRNRVCRHGEVIGLRPVRCEDA